MAAEESEKLLLLFFGLQSEPVALTDDHEDRVALVYG
jgi:hypothetical protein